MSAAQAMEDFRAAGFTVTVEGERLVVRPASRLTQDDRCRIVALKAEWMALLSPPAASAPDQQPGPIDPDRPYRLTSAQSAIAHADPWDDAAIARFGARMRQFRRHGFDSADADDLAEQTHLRDVHADYRHLCLECRHCRPGRCRNPRAAGLGSPEVGPDLATRFQDCPGFEEQPL